MKTYLAIGAHIGDMDLTAGPLLATAALAGHRTAILALTPGERGHPRLSPSDYRAQKLMEGREFAARIGASFECFDDLSDGYLGTKETVAERIASVIRALRPDTLFAHWKNSIHTDHANACTLALRARFLAGLPIDGAPRHTVTQVLHTENWEDMEGFDPTHYVPIPDKAFAAWRDAIAGQAFARGETYGFRFIDYYTALMTMRGCLARVPRATAFAPTTPHLTVEPRVMLEGTGP